MKQRHAIALGLLIVSGVFAAGIYVLKELRSPRVYSFQGVGGSFNGLAILQGVYIDVNLTVRGSNPLDTTTTTIAERVFVIHDIKLVDRDGELVKQELVLDVSYAEAALFEEAQKKGVLSYSLRKRDDKDTRPIWERMWYGPQKKLPITGKRVLGLSSPMTGKETPSMKSLPSNIPTTLPPPKQATQNTNERDF